MDGATLGAALALIKKNKPTDAQITTAVDNWLDDHPEASTTVEDGSVTYAKLHSDVKSVIDDVADKADKADTVLDTTLSRGRREESTVGDSSIAFGDDVVASEECTAAFGYGSEATGWASFAEGNLNIASGDMSHAEGDSNVASGTGAHAEGVGNEARGTCSHVEGFASKAYGEQSHAGGQNTVANGDNEYAMGFYNVPSTLYPTWVSGTEYNPGDKVIYNRNGKLSPYECVTANSDVTFTSNKWKRICNSAPTAFSIGNGEYNGAHSNAMMVEWDGNAHFAGDVYVGCAPDSTGGEKLAPDFMVGFTAEIDPQTTIILGNTLQCDTQFADIISAHESGKHVCGTLTVSAEDVSDYSFVYNLSSSISVMNYAGTVQYIIIFSVNSPTSGNIYIMGTNYTGWQLNNSTEIIADITSGMQSAKFDASSLPIGNVGAPTANNDAATKLYVDSNIKHIYRFQCNVPAHPGTVNLDTQQQFNTAWQGSPTFTDNVRVIGYDCSDSSHWRNISYTINPQQITVTVTIMPEAVAGTLTIYIAETEAKGV